MRKVLFLDFDGVLFDTLKEVFIVNRLIHSNISLFDEINKQEYDIYYKYKYLVYNIWMFNYYNPIIFNHTEENKIEETFKNAIRKRNLKEEEIFCKKFLSIRDDLVKNNYDFWQKLETPFDFFFKIKELNKKIDIVIASKKNKPAIINRFKSYDFNIDENQVYAREVLDKYSSKADFIIQYTKENNYDEVLFVDDNSNNLSPCKKYPQIKTILASWGNIAPNEIGLNQENTIIEIEKFFNL